MKRVDLRGVAIKKADQIKRAVTLLAEDLSMASGLSIPAARDHIMSLALSTDKIDIWPVLATEPKSTELDSDSFEKAFGITIDDAYDLNQNPLKIIPFSGAGKDSTISHINTFLNQSAASKVSNPVKFFLSANPHRQEQFQEVMQLANLRGIGRESIEFAFLRLDEMQFYALATRYLVRPENRLSTVQFSVYVAIDIRIKDYKLSIDQVSEKLGLSRGEIISIRNESIAVIKQAILDNNIEMPGFNVKALDQTAEKTKRPYVRKQKTLSDGEVSSHQDESEDDILSDMRTYGFNEHSLYRLGIIYEERNDIKTAILLYGAACDLSDNEDSAFTEALRRVESQSGYQYDTDSDFSSLEIFIQEKLNGNSNADLQTQFTESSSPHTANTRETEAIEAEFVELEPKQDPSRPESRNQKIIAQPHITYSLPPEIFATGNRLRMCFNSTGQNGFEVTLEVENDGAQGVSNSSPITGKGLEVTFTHNAEGKPIVQVSSPEKTTQGKVGMGPS